MLLASISPVITPSAPVLADLILVLGGGQKMRCEKGHNY